MHRFNRSEPRESALAYMRGLIAPLERKNGWTLAEEVGRGGPDRIKRMLNRIEWDADEVLDDVRDYVVEHLGDRDAVLIVDDTGFLKKACGRTGCKGSTPEPPARHRCSNIELVRDSGCGVFGLAVAGFQALAVRSETGPAMAR